MTPRTTIQHELNSLNSPLPVAPGTPYSVPPGYFEGLAEALLMRIRTQGLSAAEETAVLSPLLAGISRSLPYSLPQGYFEENLEILPLMIGEEKESPVLAAIGKELPFSVPAGYFEELSPAATPARPKARVVGMHRWMRVAAAAVVTGAIALGGWLYLGNGGDTPGASATTAAPVAQDLKKVPTRELEEFLNATAVTAGAESGTATKPGTRKGEPVVARNTADVKKLLKDVSDEELNDFLDGLPTEEDEMLLN